MIRRALLLGITASLATGPAAAQVTTHPREMALPDAPSPRPDPRDHRMELPGGLVAYAAEDATVDLVRLTALVGAGSVDGPEGAAEALAFGLRVRGPAGMAPGAFRRALRSMAADFSVTLEAERLRISIEVPGEDAQAALDILAGLVVHGPALTEADLASFRAAAGGATPAARSGGGEGQVAYEGSLAGAADLFRRQVLGGTPYGHEPTAAELAALTLDNVRAFHRRFFVTGNVVVAAAGPVALGSLSSMLRAAFSGLEVGPRRERRQVTLPSPEPTPRVFTYPADKLQGWLVLGHELPAVPREDEAALQVMNYILGGGHFDTRLFRATRDRRGLTNDDSGFLEPHRDGPGTYGFHTYGRPGAVRLLLHLTLAEMERIRREPVTEEELFVARGALADGAFSAGYRDAWATAETLAAEWLAHGDHEASATYRSRIRSVTAEDVLDAARTYLHPERVQVILVGPIDAIEAAPPMEDEGTLSDYGLVVRGG